MHHNERPTLLDVVLQSLLNDLRPRLAVVVAESNVESREVRIPLGPFFLGSLSGRTGGNRDRKAIRAFEGIHQDGGGGFPVVVVLPIDEQNLQFAGPSGTGKTKKKKEGKESREGHEGKDVDFEGGKIAGNN